MMVLIALLMGVVIGLGIAIAFFHNISKNAGPWR